MDSSFIEKLKTRLILPLPGKKAQMLLSPSFRPDEEARAHCIKAGVLILIYPHKEKLWCVLTKRQVYEGNHSGQVSFPGGKCEASDLSFEETALREAKEEVGVISSKIQVLGKLTPLYIPVSGIEVYPIVGYANNRPDFNPDPHEVDFLIEFPLYSLLDPGIMESEFMDTGIRKGVVPYFNISGNHVWGATAMILSEFLQLIKEII